MTEETHVSKTIGNRVTELRKKIDDLDGFDLAITPFIYLYELGDKSWKFAVARCLYESSVAIQQCEADLPLPIPLHFQKAV